MFKCTVHDMTRGKVVGFITRLKEYLFQVSASDEILADREEAMQNLKSQVDSYLPFILGTYIK